MPHFMKETTAVAQYEFSPGFIARMPAYSYLDYAGKAWSSSLDDPYFRTAVNIASQSLYQELLKRNGDISSLPAKCALSLWKYCNRMRYRPTPFGLCSGFSFIWWRGRPQHILLTGNIKVHLQPDFKSSLSKAATLLSIGADCLCPYLPNPSIYPVLDSYRYMRYLEDPTSGKRVFRIEALSGDEYIEELLRYCDKPMTSIELSSHIKSLYGHTEDECINYMASLISAQVFMPALHPNISGTDYLQRVQGTAGHPVMTKQVITGDRKGLSNECFNEKWDQLYVNLEHQAIQNTLSITYQQAIKDGLYCLERLLPFREHYAIADFKKAFQNKFDKQCLPLLQVLDPEIGIGYQGLGTSQNTPALLQDIPVPPLMNKTGTVAWTELHTLLLQQWNGSRMYSPLQLDDANISSLAPPTQPVPNSCSVIFRVCDEGVYIEQAGGVTACALSGRFTPLNEDIRNMAREMAQQEETANPDILFAELAYISDMHTANIDRRENLYSYEIPVLCDSVITGQNRLALNDIWVTVENDEIILWSKSHGKRIIPRLSSAFNYVRSDLTIFRFLCDLQYQGVRSNFLLDLEALFPGLPFYPRVCFRKAILHLAKWVIYKKAIEHIFSLDTAGQSTPWLAFCAQQHFPRFISLDEYDNQLVFDLEDETDTRQLLSILKNQDKTILREFIFNKDTDPLVQDVPGRPYIAQFVASLYHKGQVYLPKRFPAVLTNMNDPIKRLFIPGSEWLYYKLYIHPIRSNQLLKDHILPCLRRLKIQGLVKKWFFVRYAHPNYHLRIRLNINPKLAGHTLFQLEKILNEIAASRMIQSYNLDSYETELERYSPELITLCEDWFCHSTALLTGWLDKVVSDDAVFDYYILVLPSVKMMLEAFGYDDAEAMSIFKGLYTGMAVKVGGRIDKKHLQLKSRELRKTLFDKMSAEDIYAGVLKKQWKLFSQSLSGIAAKSHDHMDGARRQILFADLLHMHLNRLLVTDSYGQEMILYYALFKFYQSAGYFTSRSL